MDKYEQMKDWTKEELIDRIYHLENKYAWGLQPEDYAAALTDYEGDAFTKNQLSDDELNMQAIHALRYKEEAAPSGWSEDIREAVGYFHPETKKLLYTIRLRFFAESK